ncbi:MAG: hypothetical protein ABJC04_07815, partial [Verrucomicrobiota bacterium]
MRTIELPLLCPKQLRIKREQKTDMTALSPARTLSPLPCWISRWFFLLLFFFPIASEAGVQMNTFLGYDGVAPEGKWFPVVCEVRNDNASFKAFLEITFAQTGENLIRRVPVELPTSTRKRILVPVFCSTRYSALNFRLVNEKGNVVAEELNVRPKKSLAWPTPILGALNRTVSGLPVFPSIKSSRPDLQPATARLIPAFFPDNPIALEGLETIYLNSSVAAELQIGQRDALLAWLDGGGHLVVGVEQIADLTGNAWLQE